MKLFERITRHGGLKASKQYLFRKQAGLEKIQDEVDTIRYFLNEYFDIRAFPKTKDIDLRYLQRGLLLLLKIFAKLCEDNGLTYWLSSGTALGAERHHGLIPWDDDLDICMPREDYNRVLPLMKDKLAKYDIEVRWGGYYDNWGYLARLALAYKTLETGIWMDIFPVDMICIPGPLSEYRDKIDDAIDEYRNYYSKAQNIVGDQEILHKRKEIFSSYGIGEGDVHICIEAPEFGDGHRYMTVSDVYPMKKVAFEDTTMPVFYNNSVYLAQCYGENYMGFPKSGILDHKDPDGELAKTRAKRHDVDMNDVINHLEKVYHQI